MEETEGLELKLKVSNGSSSSFEDFGELIPLKIHLLICLSVSESKKPEDSTEFHLRLVYDLDSKHQIVDVNYQDKGVTKLTDKLNEEQIRKLIQQILDAVRKKYIERENKKEVKKVYKVYNELSRNPNG